MNITTAAGWSRLQAASIELAMHLAPPCHACRYGAKHTQWSRHSVPEAIKENCEVLGRGDEHEIKNRIAWIAMYYPDVFNRSRRHMM